MLLKLLCIMLAAALAAVLYRLHLLHSDLRSLTEQLRKRLNNEETNAPLFLSGGDRQLRAFTAEMNTQLELLRGQQLQYLNGDRELKNAVTNISHDLRTPLTAISGYLELLEAEECSPQAARYAAVISERTAQMRQLTEELFRYSLILSDDAAELNETVCINAVLEESIAGYYAVLTQRGIEPEITMPETPVYCKCSPTALARVFSNLLNNALKYSCGDLRITMRESGMIRFENHAAQMDQTHLAHLFDRFYTVGSAQHSTGLGLSIARTIVEQMGGAIAADYQGDMLTVTVMLPKSR